MSCGINFLSDNYVDSALVEITTGTENLQFPLKNLKNESPSYRFRSEDNTVVLRFDLQQTRNLDSIAVLGDPNGSLGLTSVSVKFSLTTDFSSATPLNVPLSAEYILGYVLTDAVSARFVEVTLEGQGAFTELSNIFIGERINIEQNNLSIGSFKYGYADNSVVRGNKYDQFFIDKLGPKKFLGGDIEFCNKEEQHTLDLMFKRHLRSEPLWMIVDPEGNSMTDAEYKLAIYGYFFRAPEWAASGGQHYNTNVRINQAG